MNLQLLTKPNRILRGIKHRASQHLEWRTVIRQGREQFQLHPLYQPDRLSEAFIERPTEPKDETILLKRICAAYHKAKQVQKSVSATYRPSNEWTPIYERNLGPVMRALAREDIDTLRSMYRNFYRNACSTGLVGLPCNMNRHYFRSNIKKKYRHLFLCDYLHRYELWRTETNNEYPATVLCSPLIGNPYGLSIDGAFIKSGSDYMHYYAMYIRRLLGENKQQTVVELGGGFGGMAYYLIRDTPQVTYVNFDLPENIALASYYLLTAFPDIPSVLYGEAELTSETLNQSRIILLPSFDIMHMPGASSAAAFNSYSLAEMSPGTIRDYIVHIGRITKAGGYFLHVNHTVDSVVSADHFGVEEQNFKLLTRKLAAWNRGRNLKSDEFEFLYKKS